MLSISNYFHQIVFIYPWSFIWLEYATRMFNPLIISFSFFVKLGQNFIGMFDLNLYSNWSSFPYSSQLKKIMNLFIAYHLFYKEYIHINQKQSKLQIALKKFNINQLTFVMKDNVFLEHTKIFNKHLNNVSTIHINIRTRSKLWKD